MTPSPHWLAGVVVDEDTSTAALIRANTPEWDALLEWLRFHDVDPCSIPAGTEVFRDGGACQIRYTAIVRDGNVAFHAPPHPEWGSFITVPAVEQGEAPPLPFPDVIARLLQPVHRPTSETT
jgi:hypothetical protein